MTRTEFVATVVGCVVLALLLGLAWVYRDLPQLDERVAPMRGNR